ncbi:SusC/RagA family TonB-linked outer membrane protein [Pedobacter deserti]|uniref:SusC/RagA family TonB-linked outer membrane protein n=1 Tax=Pedobacter deserti TaxID=2817382 RepID=UPI00210CD96B|nr:SusC/RagA family TonB-linked outer membrane protein [Pedobacter sp. SYSU D00382]
MKFYTLMIHSVWWYLCHADKRKLLMRLNLTILILTSFFLQAGLGATAQMINLTERNISLPVLLDKISQQSGYDFFYTNEMLGTNRKVSVSFKNADIHEVLSEVFKGYQLKYTIKHKTVVIQRDMTIMPAADAQQGIRVTGKVVDRNGNGIPGAGITEKGTDNRTVTESGGRFSLVVEKNATLVITYVGYSTQERTLGGTDTELVITLQESASDLEEVGVISTGYQKIQKYQLTGAASSISQKTYDQRVAVSGNFLESLEGKIPGLVYNGQSGNLSIRGVSTFNAVKKPLIVVDGFPTEIDINTINPNDIVSVNVLRDAVAASIYGARASNGVIVIETKRGMQGKPVFSFRSTYAVQDKPDFDYLKIGDGLTYAKVQYDFLQLQGIPEFIFDLIGWPVNPVQQVVFDRQSNEITDAQAQAQLAQIGAYNNLNEYNDLFYRARQTHQIDFDVSGGSDKSTYLLGLNYIGESPNERRSKYQRLILNSANTYNFSDVFKLDYRGSYTRTATERGSIPTFNDALPYERLADDNGHPLPVVNAPGGQFYGAINKTRNDALIAQGLYDQRYFPYGELNANTFSGKRDAVRFQGRLNARITDWLNVDLGGAYEHESSKEDQLRTEESYQVRSLLNGKALKDPSTGQPLFTDLPQGAFLTKINTRNWGYTVRGQLNFDYNTKDQVHDLSGIMGVEQRRQAVSGDKSTAFGYDGQSLTIKPVNLQALASSTAPAFPEAGNVSPSFVTSEYFAESFDDRRFFSAYGEGTYMYQQKYIATGSIRFDRSNLFGTSPEYRNKPFWSAGLGWRLNKETFLTDAAWVNELKLRASYGFNGNVPTSNNGPFLILQSGLNSRLNTAEIYNDILSPENQSIRWESTKNYNVGLDFALFNNRLAGTADYYYKDANDVFGQFSSDPTTGFNGYTANTASILNRGVELGLNSLNIQGPRFSWRTGLTATLNHNKVTEVMPSDISSTYYIVNAVSVQKSYPMDALFSYRYKGLNALGQPVVYDRNNAEVIMTMNPEVDVTMNDLVYSGTTTPKYVLGLNNQFSLRNFDLSFLFMYYGGHVMRVEQPNPDDINFERILQGSDNYWKQPGDELHTDVPGLPEYGSEGDFDAYSRAGYIYADRYVRKADHIRLRDVVLTYNFRQKVFERLGLSNTQLRFQGQNLWNYTFSGNDIDPDAMERRSGIRTLRLQPFYSFSLYANF